MTQDPAEQGIAEAIALDSGGVARAIHFHNTPRRRAAEVAAQLADCSPAGAWTPGGAPVAVFFEAYRNHFDVALGLLEAAGVRAWFVVPTDFPDVPVAEQAAYAAARDLDLVEDEHGDGRFAMTWAELRAVAARGHGIASHTASHCTLQEALAGPDLERELAGSRGRLEAELGVRVGTLCWRYGAAYGEDPRADAAVRAAGYDTVLAAGRLQSIGP